MYCARSGVGVIDTGGQGGQIATGGGASGAQPARSTINAARQMWLIYLEVVLALALAAFIVWWTWPKKPPQ